MKKWLLISLLACLSVSAFSKPGKLRAYMSYASFSSPKQGSYLETYLSILGRSLVFVKNDNGKFSGTASITMLFKQNDSIREFRKYELNSAEIDDTTHINFNLFDQQRILLKPGTYLLDLTISDKNRDAAPFTTTATIDIADPAGSIMFSDIEAVESFSKASETSAMAKSGYDFIPYQDYYYPSNINKLTYYAELYNTLKVLGEGGQFIVSQSIRSIENDRQIDNFYRQKRETAREVNIVFNEFDITQLPTGNYYLVLEARGRDNSLIADRKMFFQRSNPGVNYNAASLSAIDPQNTFVNAFANADTLREYIRMSFPVAGANEKLFIRNNLPKSPLTTLQQFFLDFWLKRNAADPESAWKKYYATVKGVESEFGSIYKKGYETDRGRVYLQYGPPNQRISETMNPETFPYEIWQYYRIENQSNVRFVFYTRDKALNDYLLAHSEALGEVKNVNWQYEIKRGVSPRDTNNDLYKRAIEEETWGEHTGEYYNLRK